MSVSMATYLCVCTPITLTSSSCSGRRALSPLRKSRRWATMMMTTFFVSLTGADADCLRWPFSRVQNKLFVFATHKRSLFKCLVFGFGNKQIKDAIWLAVLWHRKDQFVDFWLRWTSVLVFTKRVNANDTFMKNSKYVKFHKMNQECTNEYYAVCQQTTKKRDDTRIYIK